ncbi:hypothetical protein [Aquisediminimonas sediminicola]|uniref:hypothetical protein n=1 Tax=Alteraquisediminimonas sediminicola TaxID=2676787 RepID=UPI001C8E3323|nr:hypothetical protein [Aquisediminimonas sediminicola]
MSDIHVFIISWRGQHDRAAHIAQCLSNRLNKISIVYSGPDSGAFDGLDCQRIYRDDRLFWSDKFRACLDHCAPQEIMLVIHADCACEDWGDLLRKCRNAHASLDNMAIWSPKMRGTPWRLEKTRMERINNSDWSIVAQTDGIVFSMIPAIAQRMREADYSLNFYGLGIDWLFICAAYARNKIAVLDESVLVHHQLSRGYSSREARAQKQVFLSTQLLQEEHAAYVSLRRHMQRRKHYSKMLYWLEYVSDCLKKAKFKVLNFIK